MRTSRRSGQDKRRLFANAESAGGQSVGHMQNTRPPCAAGCTIRRMLSQKVARALSRPPISSRPLFVSAFGPLPYRAGIHMCGKGRCESSNHIGSHTKTTGAEPRVRSVHRQDGPRRGPTAQYPRCELWGGGGGCLLNLFGGVCECQHLWVTAPPP